MQRYESKFCGTLRRESVRFLLEKVQGMAVKQMTLPENFSELHFDDVEEIINIPYMNRNEVPLGMDIFKPIRDTGTELPVIVTIHGGGLVTGDRKISRNYGKQLAHMGYLVFSIEYRLAPRANVCDQLDDVCAGMDLIGTKLPEFDVDFTRMFLTGDSAGAYLATYVAAMKGSQTLQDAIGHKPTRMVFKAIGLISGMFYTNRKDPIGFLLSEQFYGDKAVDENFLRYMNPEDCEIVDNLPPAFFITSRGDFLNNYTIMYHEALEKAGKATHLVYYGEKELSHDFVTMNVSSRQSIDALTRMTKWFEEQADEARKEQSL